MTKVCFEDSKKFLENHCQYIKDNALKAFGSGLSISDF